MEIPNLFHFSDPTYTHVLKVVLMYVHIHMCAMVNANVFFFILAYCKLIIYL